MTNGGGSHTHDEKRVKSDAKAGSTQTVKTSQTAKATPDKENS